MWLKSPFSPFERRGVSSAPGKRPQQCSFSLESLLILGGTESFVDDEREESANDEDQDADDGTGAVLRRIRVVDRQLIEPGDQQVGCLSLRLEHNGAFAKRRGRAPLKIFSPPLKFVKACSGTSLKLIIIS